MTERGLQQILRGRRLRQIRGNEQRVATLRANLRCGLFAEPGASTSASTTRAPSAASADAIPRPMPEAAPVTSAVSPLSNVDPIWVFLLRSGKTANLARRHALAPACAASALCA